MKMKKCAIVVPIYKENLDDKEYISVLQLSRVLSEYDMFFAAPESLDSDYFHLRFPSFRIECFEDRFFRSIETYNELCLDEDFYGRFGNKGFEYILIHQTDAFVFSDRLEEFVDLGYDYIGAPWVIGHVVRGNIGYKILKVGNGGFSLRNIAACIYALKKRKYVYNTGIKQEDMVFSYLGDDDFKVAPYNIALQFSFERMSPKCYEKNERKLPFGCHAWWRYDVDFWMDYINSYGYRIRYADLDDYGNEDMSIGREEEFKIRVSEYFYNKNGYRAFRKQIDQFRKDRNLCVWGAGFWGGFFAEIFREIGIENCSFVDNDTNLIGGVLCGYRIISPSEIDDKSAIIVSSINNYSMIFKQISEIGVFDVIMVDNLLEIS